MSSSGSNGPPIRGYGERGEYDYNKQRRKSYYSGGKRGGPGSSSLTHSRVPVKQSETAVSDESQFQSSRRARFGAAGLGSAGATSALSGSRNFDQNGREGKMASYGSYGGSKNGYSYNSGSGSYYQNYGSYGHYNGGKGDYASGNASYYNSRGTSWRNDRSKFSGDSRLTSSANLSSGYSQRPMNGSSGNSPSEYRRDRYDSYNTTDPSGKWRTFHGASKPTLNNRNAYSSPMGSRQTKDRPRQSFPSGTAAPLGTGKRGSPYSLSRSSYSLSGTGHNYATLRGKYGATEYPGTRRPEEEYDTNISGGENYSLSPSHEDDNPDFKGGYDLVKADVDSLAYEKTNDESDDENISLGSPTTPQNDREISNRDEFDIDDEDEDHTITPNKAIENTPNADADIKERTPVLNYNDSLDLEESQRNLDNGLKGKLLEEENKISSISNEVEPKEPFSERSIKEEDGTGNVVFEDKPVAPEKVEPENIVKIDVSNEICYPDGCTYPKIKIETEFDNLKSELEMLGDQYSTCLKYTLSKPITDLKEYPFFVKNVGAFLENKDKYVQYHRQKLGRVKATKIRLWKEYYWMNKHYQEKREKMDEQLKLIHPADDELKRELESAGTNNKHPSEDASALRNDAAPSPGSSRRGRRHGDLVTTEAEFQEILKSLGKELEEDPIVRAKKVAAVIPDFNLDSEERNYKQFFDSTNMVTDKEKWASRVKTDFQDNFSALEHALFCEGFCLYPKRFGAISRHMGGLRTAGDCVVHYYATKRAANYKQLVFNFKKRASRKNSRKLKTSKSKNSSLNNTPVSTPGPELGMSEIITKSPFALTEAPASNSYYNEETFTETGRRKRAAAPVFENNPGDKKRVEQKGNESPPHKKKLKKGKKEEISMHTNQETGPESESSESQVLGAPFVLNNKDEKRNGETEHNTTFDIIDGESKERKRQITSYWSITEANQFPTLLGEHGSKWTTIADKLVTKSATMVRNYFQRNTERFGWNKIVEEADARHKAKFDAVMNTKPEGPNVLPDLRPPSTYQAAPVRNLVNPSPPPDLPDPPAPSAPMGTFQHTTSTLAAPLLLNESISSLIHHDNNNNDNNDNDNNNKTSPAIEPPSLDPNIPKPQEVTPVVVERPLANNPPPPPKPAPQIRRSSIMSLLNSDPTPPEKPEVRNGAHTLTALLNSPSNSITNGSANEEEASAASTTNGFNALLTAINSTSDPNSNNNVSRGLA